MAQCPSVHSKVQRAAPTVQLAAPIHHQVTRQLSGNTGTRKKDRTIPGPGSRASAISHPSLDLGIRVPGIGSILRSALAESTWRAYSRGWSLFQQFCQTKNTQVQGTMTERNVTEFLLHLKNSGVSRAQAGQHVAAIVFVSKLWGIGTISNSFLIKKILEGWRRQAPVRGDTRKPITSMLLQALVKELPSLVWDNYEVKLWTVAFSLMFFGAFRNSELIPRAKVTTRASDGGLPIENIRMVKEAVQIFIRRAKNDQRAVGRWIMLYPAHMGEICPVRAAREYLKVRPPGGGALTKTQRWQRAIALPVHQYTAQRIGKNRGRRGRLSHTFIPNRCSILCLQQRFKRRSN
ncbi:uncharacterized protein LOC115088167 isoform X2 [Rhinatrema bivittatum]|uniref:uncharacterized protein LOC115088167 isoform X2 n=1 Tax=Rhinatrema bivittatum TaxID=194408 RepID=UPI00112EB1B2|nr:uncharacterized protein LOC115088167 isoform X2 [Rhinatrema bivittatum]